MNLSQLIAEVASRVVRPDLIEDGTILSAVLSSTLKLHTMDLFYKDGVTSQVTFDTETYIQQLDTSAFTRYRRLWWARKNDNSVNTSALPGTDPFSLFNNKFNFLTVLDPSDIINGYRNEKTDVMYQTGSTLWMKSSTPLQYLLIGYYSYPNLDATTTDGGLSYPNYKSWIADERPYAIIFDACSNVFNITGNLDQARKFDSPATDTHDGGLVQNEIKRLLADNILAGDN